MHIKKTIKNKYVELNNNKKWNTYLSTTVQGTYSGQSDNWAYFLKILMLKRIK